MGNLLVFSILKHTRLKILLLYYQNIEMKVIANSSIPISALSKLKEYSNVLLFETTEIIYHAISGHPDVFFCFTDKHLVIAPNTPTKFKKTLSDNNISYIEGQKKVGNNYPDTATYNAVITEKFLIHNLKITDNLIKETCNNKIAIHVNQAYTRCNLLPLKNDSFITSDKGIYKTLQAKKLNIIYVDPKGIILPGFNNGFFGGACGVTKNQVFIVGSLNFFTDGEKVTQFIEDLGYQIIELYNGSLYDGGSLIFI